MTSEPPGLSQAAWAAATTLMVDHATADVLLAFRAAGVRALLLKGPSVARWLYRDGEPRPYLDTDLLVHPADATEAGRALTRMGYAPQLDERRMPDWWRPHASVWVNADQGTSVDLHHRLQGVRVDAERAWAMLSRDTVTLEVAGASAVVLALPARMLYVALSAANDGPSSMALIDLDRALEQVSGDLWTKAAALAVELRATDGLFAGLTRRRAGVALASRLGLTGEGSVEMGLRSAGAPREALTVEQIARTRGMRNRMAIIADKVFPPPTYMRYWSRLTRRKRLGLVLAYGYRVAWVAKKAFPALMAWWRVRRALTPPRP
jgi:hypothetical protein